MPSLKTRSSGVKKVSPPPRLVRSTAPVPQKMNSRLNKLENVLLGNPQTPGGVAAHKAGKIVGSLLGAPNLGSMAAHGLATLFGHGDYTVTSNSLMGGSSTPSTTVSSIPVFSKDGRRGIRVVEREYLGDVISSATPGQFKNTSYPINPAQLSTFPWLSTLGAQFEQWEPNGMVFEFVSTSSEFNGLGQSLGTVIMGTDYDPMVPPATSKILLENFDYSCSAKSSASLMHGIECAPLERGDRLLLTRPTAPVSGDSLRFYDLGSFQIATQGISTASVNLGELWVSYDVSFFKKQIYGGQLGNTILSGFYETHYNVGTYQPFGDGNFISANDGPLSMAYSTFVADYTTTFPTVTFPSTLQVGSYRVSMVWIGPNVTPPPVPSGSHLINCTVAPWTTYASGAVNGIPNQIYSPGSPGVCLVDFLVTITGAGAKFQLATGALGTGVLSFASSVSQIRPGPLLPL